MKTVLLSICMLFAVTAWAGNSDGERLTYVVGCVNCHHQSPAEFMNAPSLLTVRDYTPEEFIALMRTGVTADGTDLLEMGSVMGVVSTEQFSYLTDGEMMAIYTFLLEDWTLARAQAEEAKIPLLYREEILEESEE